MLTVLSDGNAIDLSDVVSIEAADREVLAGSGRVLPPMVLLSCKSGGRSFVAHDTFEAACRERDELIAKAAAPCESTNDHRERVAAQMLATIVGTLDLSIDDCDANYTQDDSGEWFLGRYGWERDGVAAATRQPSERFRKSSYEARQCRYAIELADELIRQIDAKSSD